MNKDENTPLASICITNFNSIDTIKESMESILSSIDDRFEVVVVDNFSKDGSLEYLEHLATQGKIRLITAHCTRGLGRLIAFMRSKGRYVFASVDTDAVYKPIFAEVLDEYRAKFEGKLLLLRGMQLSSREVMKDILWRDLQWGEDRDVWRRASLMGKLLFVDREVRVSWRRPGKGSLRKRFRYHYEMARDSIHLGFCYAQVAAETRSILSMILLSVLFIPCFLLSRVSQKHR